MKHSFLASASVGAILVGGAAQAADVGARPSYKAPAYVPSFTWTGFYVGGHIGTARTKSTISDDPSSVIPWLGTPTDLNGTSLIGGIQAGYNHQISQLVLGLEADLSFGLRERSASGLSIIGADTFTTRFSALGTVRGRVGFAFDRFLVYGTGGVAFAQIKNELTDPPAFLGFTASSNKNLTGWTAGGGVEYAFTDHWSAKAEYLHVGFASQNAIDNTGGGYVFGFKNSIDVARIGINYKF